ncbi:Glucan 1,3-beta-glucosidase 3 [Cryptotrichosporon argae]
MGLLDKLKHGHSSSSSLQLPAAAPLPLEQSLHRYRKQRGVNLGSWFALERWIAPHVFQSAKPPGQSDFDVASGDNAKRLLEQHWDSWITESDWQWIASKGFNSVRLPIGYYHLAAACPDVLAGTDFEPFAEVYAGAWQRITKAVSDAERHGLGVLIDLHGAAGAQNTDAHSGMSTGKVAFWSSANQRSTSLALRFLASHFASTPNVVGIELLNEPQNNGKLQKWYETTIKDVRAIATDLPVYIGDAWDTHWYAQWAGKRDDFVVVDHHLYRCFTDADKALSGDQHVQKLLNDFQNTFASQSAAARGAVIIGEWSASLDAHSLPPGPDTEKDRHRRAFARAELDLFERHAAGWWFWTYKKGGGWDAGWSARDAVQAEILPATVGKQYCQPAPGAEAEACARKHDDHKTYWQAHGGSPNPEAFKPGFEQGWRDALLFQTIGSELGFVSAWATRRRQEYERGQSLGKATWEWEHGFGQGVAACLAASQ